MSRLFLFGIFAFAVSALVLSAQEQSLKRKDMPKAILEAFQKSYPKAVIKGYAKETEKETVIYEIECVEGKFHRDVSYRADGSLVSIEESFPYQKLPEAVHNTIQMEYPGAEISICEKIIKGETVEYELAIQSGEKKYELVFDAKGSLIKTENK